MTLSSPNGAMSRCLSCLGVGVWIGVFRHEQEKEWELEINAVIPIN